MILSGILLNPIGEAWANQSVKLTSNLTSDNVLQYVSKEFNTDSTGFYEVDIPNGFYSVSVFAGRLNTSIGNILISEDTTQQTINELLMLGQVAQSPTVYRQVAENAASALASKIAAQEAEQGAESSAESALTSQTSASSSATQAQTSATLATQKATESATSATASEQSNIEATAKVQVLRNELLDPTIGSNIISHKEGNVSSFLDSSTTGLGDFSAHNLLQIHVGDSTTEQAGGSGFLFDFITTFWRGGGMPANGMLGTINFGGSGYRLKNFVEDPVNNAFVGPTGTLPGVAALPGNWDYYGHKPAGAVSLLTALKYRSTVPSNVKHVQWVLCYGINDLILYNDVGTGTVEQIADYISGYILKAIGKIQAAYPGDSVVLRTPNPMTARPFAAAFPSSTAYPTFDTDLVYAQQLVSNWNNGLRLAYQKASNIYPRTVLFDTWVKVFGNQDTTVDSGQTATTNPSLQDRVHPSNFGYRQIGHELCNLLFGNTQTRQTYNGRRFMADQKITNGWTGNAYDYYGQYFKNNQKFKELGSWNIVAGGSTFIDLDAEPTSLKKILSGYGAGRIFCTVGVDELTSSSFLLGNATSIAVNASGANSRITGVTPPASVKGTRSILTFYTDNYLSPPKISFAGPLVVNTPVYYAIMDVVPSGLASLTLTTTLAVSIPVVVQIYRHISNTRTLIATGTISANGFNKVLVSGTDFTAINSVGLLQEVWEVLPTTATGVPAGCAIKLTLNPN